LLSYQLLFSLVKTQTTEKLSVRTTSRRNILGEKTKWNKIWLYILLNFVQTMVSYSFFSRGIVRWMYIRFSSEKCIIFSQWSIVNDSIIPCWRQMTFCDSVKKPSLSYGFRLLFVLFRLKKYIVRKLYCFSSVSVLFVFRRHNDYFNHRSLFQKT
jgi:hypothetical protein